MFQLLKNPSFDFMGRRNLVLFVTAGLVLASVVVLVLNGLNLGIEFTGGTEMQVKFAETPNVSQIRDQMAAAGLSKAVVTTIGDPKDNEVYIRLATRGGADAEDDPTIAVLEALRGGAESAAGTTERDLNIVDESTLARVIADAPASGSALAGQIAKRMLELRRQGTIFHSFDDLSSIEGMTPQIVDYLRENATIGPLALRSQSFIGPAVGRELVEKALLAIVGSLIGMLIYIWIRFRLQWGLAAVAALAHDTLVTLALFSIFNQEMSLPVVAAFLTLVGYSVNDTVVVFDRIRENLASHRSRELSETVNLSINQTLARTVITSGLTWIVVLCLFLFGGHALRSFSFVLTIGVVVGTYSSIFVASPIVVVWQGMIERHKGIAPKAAPDATRRTKKVRRSTTG